MTNGAVAGVAVAVFTALTPLEATCDSDTQRCKKDDALVDTTPTGEVEEHSRRSPMLGLLHSYSEIDNPQ